MLTITKDSVRIRVEAEEELDSLSHAAKECAPDFEEAVKSALKKSRKWGWCCVKVSVNLRNGPVSIEGTAYLGHCSYESRTDFIDNSGYYDQMVDDAIEDLAKNLKDRSSELADHLEEFAIDDQIKSTVQRLRDMQFAVKL